MNAHRTLLASAAAATLALALLIPASPTAAVGPAASFPLRLEAGPQAAYRFDSAGSVTGRRALTLAAPATVTGSARSKIPGHDVYLRVASGALAGWWVAEGRTAYRPGIVLAVAYSPARAVALRPATFELYRFDVAGGLVAAKALAVPAAGLTVRIDRASVVNGMRVVRIADGAWAGWWLPGTISAPQRIACSAGSPPATTAATQGRIVRSVPAATGEIALTFDMGGRLTPALAILRYLELERVCATIFPTGVAASTTTGRAVMAEVKAHPELFELGNHTQHHCNLRDGGGGAACPATRPTASFVRAELASADAIALQLSGRHTTPYWRPPYGAVDAALVAVAAGAGYPYAVMWSIDTIDWRPVADGGPTAAQSAAKVIARRSPGAIVLMHLGGYTTRNALPAMLTGLRAAGYLPTTLSALYR